MLFNLVVSLGVVVIMLVVGMVIEMFVVLGLVGLIVSVLVLFEKVLVNGEIFMWLMLNVIWVWLGLMV